MPNYKIRQHDNGVHYIEWSEGRRSKRHSTGKTLLAEAQKYYANWLLAGDATIDSSAGCIFKVRELWDVYYKKHVEAENVSTDGADFSWKNLELHFGDKLLAQVDDELVEEYERLRAKGAIGRPSKPTTIRRELLTMRAAFSWCASRKAKFLIKPADVPQFELPPEGDPRDRWLRTPEIQKLLDAGAALRSRSARATALGVERLSRGERFLWLALETASRKTAIFQLTWDRVDFETRVIDYNVPGRKKTKKRRAVVPISDALLPVLKRAYEERDQTNPDNLVLDNPADIWKTIQVIANKAAILGVSPHVLRHTAATHMARRGVPLWLIAGVLGNSLDMVEKVYAKHCPEGLANAVEKISDGTLEAVA